MIWIVIGKMFNNQSFTENKAVINVKTVQICFSEIECIKKSICYKMRRLMQIDELLFEF